VRLTPCRYPHAGSCISMASRRGEFEHRVLGNFSYPIVNPGPHFKFVPSGPIFRANLPGPLFWCDTGSEPQRSVPRPVGTPAHPSTLHTGYSSPLRVVLSSSGGLPPCGRHTAITMLVLSSYCTRFSAAIASNTRI
jgi:hypothetical protein